MHLSRLAYLRKHWGDYFTYFLFLFTDSPIVYVILVRWIYSHLAYPHKHWVYVILV